MRISDWSSDVCSSDLAAGALQMAANRVAAVAQVHRNFYADEAEEVTVVGFLRRLCADLSRILDREIEVRGDEGAVPSILVQPIGLITNEFVIYEIGSEHVCAPVTNAQLVCRLLHEKK